MRIPGFVVIAGITLLGSDHLYAMADMLVRAIVPPQPAPLSPAKLGPLVPVNGGGMPYHEALRAGEAACGMRISFSMNGFSHSGCVSLPRSSEPAPTATAAYRVG